LQTISIPELAMNGQPFTYDSMKDTLGFELEDLNFDGYQDIRLFDTTNGNYRVEWDGLSVRIRLNERKRI